MHLHRRSRPVLLLLQLDRGYPPLVHHAGQRLSLLASLAQHLHGRTIWRRCHSSFAARGTSCLRMAFGPPMDQTTEITVPRSDGTQGRATRRNPRRKPAKRINTDTHAPLPFKAAPSPPDITARPRRPHLKRCHPESNEGPAVSLPSVVAVADCGGRLFFVAQPFLAVRRSP
jgi:hypothetical protein